ncbi:MAG: hypothetical protein JXR22_09775 [Prolixibacteraceae bacterium]|nr:hypothetical protein [Prolixibacteraceae bacterium]
MIRKVQYDYSMLKIRNIVLMGLLMAGANLVYSQNNALKIGLPGPILGDYSLGVEQIIHPGHTMNVNIGYWDSGIGLINIKNLFIEGKHLWLTNEGGGWHASLEQRNYFALQKDNEKQNFYWGPYFRYWQKRMVLNDYIQNEQIPQQQLFDVAATLRGIGVGAQLGYQLRISERFWIDFYFIGMGIERVKLKATYSAVGEDNFDYEFIAGDVRKAFDQQARWIKDNVKLQSGPHSLFIELPVTLPAFRAGINVAIKLD